MTNRTRVIFDHRFSEANSAISIIADEQTIGGASHDYQIGVDLGTEERTVVIQFQAGAIKEVGRNGITDEALIAVVIDRLRGFQDGEFRCRENAIALTKLEEAMLWLNKRTIDRMRRGVEGVSKA